MKALLLVCLLLSSGFVFAADTSSSVKPRKSCSLFYFTYVSPLVSANAPIGEISGYPLAQKNFTDWELAAFADMGYVLAPVAFSVDGVNQLHEGDLVLSKYQWSYDYGPFSPESSSRVSFTISQVSEINVTNATRPIQYSSIETYDGARVNGPGSTLYWDAFHNTLKSVPRCVVSQ